jgi:hypothetical protein
MAGPGVAWFEPGSPLIFQLDGGDIHVIPRLLITAVEPYEGDEPHEPDEQILRIDVRPGAGLCGVIVFAKLPSLEEWNRLPAAKA